MTYNFDPDRWFEDERRRLERRHQTGEIDERTLNELLAELDRRYEAILRRLDGTFQLPR